MGGPGTGKTRQIARRVADALENGAEPTDIMVFASTEDAARELLLRIGELAGKAAGEVSVQTPRRFALEVLSTPAARSFTGRDPRLLTPFETSAIMEDVKTTGVLPSRLREILKYIYRGWTELRDDDPE